MNYKLEFSKESRERLKRIKQIKPNFFHSFKEILLILEKDPFMSPPPFKCFDGELKNCYFRQARLDMGISYLVRNDKVFIISLESLDNKVS
jgi:Txe/YoeB family toxin of Txe-Axe toxin-antitoxin module